MGADWLTGGAEGPEGSVICIGYFLAGIAWLLFRYKRKTGSVTLPSPQDDSGTLKLNGCNLSDTI